ncbi:MAG: DUF1963 domain-containing protein [Bacilli bacterium]|nr:DUF1963 domain-containing protein [Bacilli bacterium]
MSQAIGLKVAPFEGYGSRKSYFFGDPILPISLVDKFDDETFFFGMINLKEIASLDTEGKLPHEGFLYLFLHLLDSFEDECPSHFAPVFFYSKVEPTHVVDDFNEVFLETFPNIGTPKGMAFSAVPEDAMGTKLLGVPYDWNYENKPKELLLTISHLDEELDFCAYIDGLSYVFFGPKENPFGGATMFLERS